MLQYTRTLVDLTNYHTKKNDAIHLFKRITIVRSGTWDSFTDFFTKSEQLYTPNFSENHGETNRPSKWSPQKMITGSQGRRMLEK